MVDLSVQDKGKELDEDPPIGGQLDSCSQVPAVLGALDEHEGLLLLVSHSIPVQYVSKETVVLVHIVAQVGKEARENILLLYDLALLIKRQEHARFLIRSMVALFFVSMVQGI